MKSKQTGLCNFYIDPELKKQFNEVCRKRGITIGVAQKELMEYAMKKFIDVDKAITVKEIAQEAINEKDR